LRLEVHARLEPSGELWTVYERAFEDLRALAVQRHVMFRSEFDDLMCDERVLKLLVVDQHREGDGGPDGTAPGSGTDRRVLALATMTNDLAAAPLISPEFFEHRWPEHYEAGRLWYVSFVAVDPTSQRAGVMAMLIARMVAEVQHSGGVISVDICEPREASHSLSSAIERAAKALVPAAERRRLDAQTYWGYEFPRSVV
jgi:GNAT superfamily N-acetyltransferase